MEVNSTSGWAWPRAGAKGDAPSDGPLGTALCVAETIAKRHGGEVRLRSCGDGGVFVELRFPIPAPPA
jgi:signal transduction histidine kinase